MSENVPGFQSRTFISTESCKFTWSIENFTLCGLQGEEHLISPMFTTRQSSLTTWALLLYPNRNKTPENTGDVSIYLSRSTTDSSAHYAQFQLSIVDSNGTKQYYKPEAFSLFNERRPSGYKNFINREALFGLSQRSSLLPQDTLTIMCDLKTSRVDEYKSPSVKSSKSAAKPTTSAVVSKKPDSLIYDLQQLHDKKMHSDFTLKVGEEEFKVHKNILCARSSVFDTMLSCDMKEKLTNCVKITEFDPRTIKIMLRYIYCGQVEGLTPKNGIQLYSAADKYNLQYLKNVCVEYLLKNLSVDYFCDVLLLGELHNEEYLMIATRNFFRANCTAIKKTEKWLSLSKTNPNLVIAMYEFMLSK